MPRNLTGKQAKFALSVAMGKSLAESYREAYEPSNPTAMSVYANARRARKHPGISQRIAELKITLLPGPEDMKALYQHALAVATQLTILGRDEKVRLRAAQWIAGEAERMGKLAKEAMKLSDEEWAKLEEILSEPAGDEERPAKSGAELLAEIRQAPAVEREVPRPPAPETREEQGAIRRKPAPLMVEAEPTDATSLKAGSGAGAATPEAAGLAPPEPVVVDDTTARGTPAEPATTGMETAREWARVPVPGYFPPRYRRVRVVK